MYCEFSRNRLDGFHPALYIKKVEIHAPLPNITIIGGSGYCLLWVHFILHFRFFKDMDPVPSIYIIIDGSICIKNKFSDNCFHPATSCQRKIKARGQITAVPVDSWDFFSSILCWYSFFCISKYKPFQWK